MGECGLLDLSLLDGAYQFGIASFDKPEWYLGSADVV